MPYDESPQLEEFKNGLPDSLSDLDKLRRRNRIIIGILALLLFLLSMLNSYQSRTGALSISGKGTVVGSVINELGQPLVADIFVIGMEIEEMTDQGGNFQVDNIPIGTRAIVVAIDEGGVEHQVEVREGTIVNLGRIQLVSTPAADE